MCFQSLVGLNFQQEKREADFRYGLVRLRENAESIAFYGGEKKEENLILKVRLLTWFNIQDGTNKYQEYLHVAFYPNIHSWS